MRIPGIYTAMAVSFFALSAQAQAGTVTFSYNGYSVADDTNVRIDATLKSNPTISTKGTYGSGQITLHGTTAGQKIAAWCIDAFDILQGSGTYNVITSNFLNRGTSGTPISTTVLGELGALVRYGNANINTAYVSPAVQIAIWDLEYAGQLTSATPFVSSDSNVNAEVTTLLADIRNGTLKPYANLGEVIANGNQGLLFDLSGSPVSPVPLPGALPLLGSAILALGGLGAKAIRSTKAT